MCGIIGIVGEHIDKIPISRFNQALDLMAHRGPNDSGIEAGKKYIFGHRRLSIIDTSKNGHQPMVSRDKRFVISFNGEIYNFKDIKLKLEKIGYKFYSNSDTEVLLNSFHYWGINCIEHLNGMFAFSIYDKYTEEVYLVRDRLGIKPLFYSHRNKELIFASEVKSILHIQQEQKKLNMSAVSSYFSFRYPVLNDTFIEGINSLPPAHYLIIKNNQISIKSYWNASHKFSEQKTDKGEFYYLNKLRTLIKSSVELRMISDVPFGAYLSGGVDSSAITALMANASDNPIKTYTIGFEDDDYNEFKYGNQIAKKFNTIHNQIILSPDDYLTAMEHLITVKDAPLSVPNEVPLYLMSKELKKDITVVLSGEGADELFGGYGRIFRSVDDYAKIKDITQNRTFSQNETNFLNKCLHKYGTLQFKDELDHFLNIYSYINNNLKQAIMKPDFDHHGHETKIRYKFQNHFNELSEDSYLNKMMYLFEQVHLPGLLQRVDITTMATGVEARVPFVDHRLVEFAYTIPPHYKIKWATQNAENSARYKVSNEISETLDIPKFILKKAFEGILPNKVLYRKKMGFPVPLHRWFGGDFNKYAHEMLLSNNAHINEYLEIGQIKRMLTDQSLCKDQTKGMLIWMLVNLELFCRKYFN